MARTCGTAPTQLHEYIAVVPHRGPRLSLLDALVAPGCVVLVAPGCVVLVAPGCVVLVASGCVVLVAPGCVVLVAPLLMNPWYQYTTHPGARGLT